jgi:hypothetical protein
MTKNRILGCLRVPPGVRVPPVEHHCSKATHRSSIKIISQLMMFLKIITI